MGRDPGPGPDVRPRRGAERPQVRLHEEAAALSLRDPRRAQPLLGERQAVRAASLPGPRRRHPQQVQPQPMVADEPGRLRAQLLRVPRPLRERRSQLLGLRHHLRLRDGALLESQPPRPARLAHAHGDAPERACRVEVDGHPQRGRLDDAAILQGTRQVLPAEPVQAGPQRHVPGRRVLVLDAAHRIDDRRDGGAGGCAREQALALEQGRPELRLGQGGAGGQGGARRHARIIADVPAGR